MYIDNIDDIVNEYNNTYPRAIKMKPVDVKDNAYIDFKKEVNDKNPKFKVGDHVRTSKYKNIFAKGYTPNWSEEIFVIKKLKIHFHGHMLLMISMTATELEPLDFAYASSKEFLDIQATIECVFTLKLLRDMTRTCNDLNGEEIIRTFFERELQKTDQQKFRMEKVIKKKDDKLYVKWKGYDSSFNSWIDKKDLV